MVIKNGTKFLTLFAVSLMFCVSIAVFVNSDDRSEIETDDVLGSQPISIQSISTLSTERSVFVTSVTTLLNGNVVVVGDGVGLGTGDFSTVSALSAGYNGIIACYDEYGSIQWVQRLSSLSGSTFINSISSTSDGGFVLVGQTQIMSGDFAGLTVRGIQDAFIAKYNSSGVLQYIKNFGGVALQEFFDVAETSDGGFVAVGTAYGTSFGTGDLFGVVGPGSGNDKLNNGIIVKFSSSLVLEKVIFDESFFNCVFRGVDVKDNGEIVAVGEVYGGGAGIVAVCSDTGSEYVISKNYLPLRLTSVISTTDGGFAIAGSFGSVGNYMGFPIKLHSAGIFKFDSLNDFQWLTTASALGPQIIFNDLVETSGGDFICTGYISSSQSYGFSGDFSGTYPRGLHDGINVGFDSSGDLSWTRVFGGTGMDESLSITALQNGGYVSILSIGVSDLGGGDFGGLSAYTSTGGIGLLIYFGEEKVLSFYSVPSALTVQTGNVWSYTPVSLPAGAVISVTGAYWLSSNGTTISGVAPIPVSGMSESFNIIVTATMADYISAQQVFTITVNLGAMTITSVPPDPSIQTGSLWSYTPVVDVSGSVISVTGAYWLSSDGSLISGFAPVPVSGVSQVFDVTVTAVKAGYMTATQKFTITVNLGSMSITSSPPGGGSVLSGVYWSYIPTANVSGAVFNVSGVSWLVSNGVIISGTAPVVDPGSSESFTVTVTAVKSGYVTAVQTFTLVVSAEILPDQLPSISLSVQRLNSNTFFFDLSDSLGHTSISIAFGDGIERFDVETIAYSYGQNGVYTVVVTAENEAGISTLSKLVFAYDETPETSIRLFSDYSYLTAIPKGAVVDFLMFPETWLSYMVGPGDDLTDSLLIYGTPNDRSMVGVTYTVSLMINGVSEVWNIEVLSDEGAGIDLFRLVIVCLVGFFAIWLFARFFVKGA